MKKHISETSEKYYILLTCVKHIFCNNLEPISIFRKSIYMIRMFSEWSSVRCLHNCGKRTNEWIKWDWMARVDITNNQKKTNAGKGLCLCPDPMTVPQKEHQPLEFLLQLGPLLLSWLRSEGPACCLQYLRKVWSQIGAKLATDSHR